MTPELLDRLLPFHCVLDDDLLITAAGSSLSKIVGTQPVGRLWSDLFTGPLEVGNLRRRTGQLLVAQADASGIQLRGQLIDEPTGGWLLAWSPWLDSNDQFASSGLTLNDFAVHDPLVDLLHLMDAYDRARREAAEPLERIRRFFEVSPDLMFLVDMQGRILQANEKAAVVLGVPPDELTTMSLVDVVEPDSVAVMESAWNQLRQGASVTGVEVVVLRRPDGAGITTEWGATPDPSHGLVYATARDLTDGSRRLAAEILDGAPNPMMVMDPDARVFYANRKARRLFAPDSDDLTGALLSDLVPGWVDPAEPPTLDGPESGPGLLTVAGRQFQTTSATIVIEDVPHTLVALDDVSGRRELERELTAARDAAVALAQTKSDLLANTSHEIRTPLTAILGLADILLDSPLDDDQREVVHTARVAGDRLLSLVNDFLSFAKGEAEVLSLETTVFSPSQLVEECSRIVAQQARDNGNEVTITVRGSTPSAVLGDREKLRTAVLNVLGNAVKFTHDGRVELAVSGEAGLTIAIADTGIGIPPERLSSLFQPFAQVDASTTRRYGGSGLGLAISRQLMSVMGGTITVDSEPGVGSVFTLSVPMHAARPDREAATVSRPITRDLDGLHVLLVEDDRLNSTLVIRMLQRLGAEVTWVDDGAQAVDAYRQGGAVWDVVLMDCHMPVLDGFEATRRLRSQGAISRSGRPLPIVALTASAFSDDEARCRAAGMDGFIAKPVRLMDFPANLAPYRPTA